MYPIDPSCPHLVHRQAANQRDAYHTHAVILLGSGCSAEPVVRAWLMEPETFRRDLKRDRQGGILQLRQVAVRGGTCARNADKGKTDPIHFRAACHQQHNPSPADGGSRRDAVREIPNHTDQRRVNMTGVIDLERLAPVMCFEEFIGTASNRAWFKPVEPTNPKAEPIHGICDNARDDRSKQVSAFPDTSKIELGFLLPSAPNLNLIGQFWKCLKKQVVDKRHSDTYDHFKPACETYFTLAHQHASQRRSVLTEHFETAGQCKTEILHSAGISRGTRRKNRNYSMRGGICCMTVEPEQ